MVDRTFKLPLRVYVKNTFLTFEPAEEPFEDAIPSEGQGCAQGSDSSSKAAAEEVESVRSLWASMKERHKTRAKSHPCRRGLDGLNGLGSLYWSPTTSSTSDFSDLSSVSTTTRSHSPVSSATSPRASATHRVPPAAPQGLAVPLELPHQALELAPQGLVTPGSSSQNSTVVEQDRKTSKKVRSRPPKPKRIIGKQLAQLLYSVQDSTEAEKEAAEVYFAQETEGDQLLYDYSMSVLQSMKSEKAVLESGREEQETHLVASQAPSCINLPRPSTLTLMPHTKVPPR